ncbi:MAG TPA: nitroreductase family deazaflavin-dependent oxidoreductase [Candidatus Limnocylindrales bacterium]|nr:nitroreductase family deazaflavin-dependent oxidoreductase [Candidatus Limnocylindrales bacterium]
MPDASRRGAARGSRLAFLQSFTTHVINPITRRFAGRLPGFGIVIHTGRKSGRVYRTPMNVFRDGPDYLMALTYGRDVGWVRNVLAAGGCELEVRGKVVRVVNPELFVDPSRHLMPLPVRLALGLFDVDTFLRLRPA